MQNKEKEEKWKKLLRSLREAQSGLPVISDERLKREGELERTITQTSKMIMIIHRLFEELKKQIEEKENEDHQEES